MWTLGKQISPKMNQILEIHAEWLDKNVSKLAGMMSVENKQKNMNLE